METENIHDYLDYKLCLSILRTLVVDKNLNKNGTDNVFSIITFEDSPHINSPDELGVAINDRHSLWLIKASFNLNDKRETWVCFNMYYDGAFSAVFREGDPIKGTEKETGEHFEDFRDALDFFYEACFRLRNPDNSEYFSGDEYGLKKLIL
jgi:hypothetical protein